MRYSQQPRNINMYDSEKSRRIWDPKNCGDNPIFRDLEKATSNMLLIMLICLYTSDTVPVVKIKYVRIMS
jgi:hypothetical protein